MKIDYLDLIYFVIVGIGILNGLFLTAYLWTQKKGSVIANRLLGDLVFCISFILLSSMMLALSYLANELKPMPFFTNYVYIIYFNSLYVAGPLLYYYFNSATNKDFVFKKVYFRNFIPAFIITGTYLLLVYNFTKFNYYVIYAVYIFVLIPFLIFSLLTLRNYIKVYRTFKCNDSVCEKGDIVLLGIIMFSVLFIWILHAIDIIFPKFDIHTFLALFASMLIYYLIFSELFYNKIGILNRFSEKYKTSKLANDDLKDHFDKLLRYMEKSEPHKETDITLPKVAKILSVQPHLLSQVINSQTGNSFPDFINSYRIEDAKKMLLDPKNVNLTIASIAYDCGFNTLSAFNTAFKKFTKMTPSQFRSQTN